MLTPEEVLALVPQRKPFRFIDRIIEIDASHVVGEYTFRHDEYFYAGHFPGAPITPGVVLLETMCQIGVVAFGIHLLGLEASSDEVAKHVTLFTESTVEFTQVVPPGTTVRVEATKLYFRRLKLKSSVALLLPDGRIAAKGTVAGIGVPRV